MPDFAVRTQIVTKDMASPMFMRAGRAADRFGSKADKSMARASRSMDKLGATTKKSMGASKRSIDKSTRSINRMGSTFDRQIDRMERRAAGFKGITAGVLGADVIREGFRAATREIGSFIMEGAKIQRATTEFGTFTRSVERGVKVVNDLRILGARTPFEFEDFTRPTKILLGLRAVTQDQLIPTLTMLGDTASGSADKLNRIAFAFAEVKSNGRATMQEVRQFTNAGVPLLATVADMYRKVGDSTEDAMLRARKMVKEGKLTGTVMVKAFKIMTSEGGIFFKGMEKTSKDFLGRLSTLKDEINITRQDIGLRLIPTLSKYVDKGIEIARAVNIWAQANQGLIKEEVIKWLDTGKQILKDTAPILKTVLGVISDLLPVVRELSPILPFLAFGWLANKVALGLLAAINIVPVIAGITKAVWAAAFGQLAWSAAILLIPGGIAVMVAAVIAGVALIGAGIFLLVKNWETVRDVLISGAKKVISAWAQVFFAPFIGLIKGLAFAGMKLGQALGVKSMEREFRSVMLTMDEFSDKIKKFGQDAPKPFKIVENSVQSLRTKFGGPILDQGPAFVEPGSPEFLRKSIFEFGTPGQAKKLTALEPTAGMPFSITNISNIVKDTIVKFKEREDAETPFAVPESVKTFIEDKKVIEHVVKLVVPGSGQDQVINLTPGSEAPPVEINLLGAN